MKNVSFLKADEVLINPAAPLLEDFQTQPLNGAPAAKARVTPNECLKGMQNDH